jgi:hypothetical protein
MRSALLTVIFVVGAALPGMGYAQDQVITPAGCCNSAPRDPNLSCFQNAMGWLPDQFRSMPQTCYSPSFGCYPGNGRDIQRYPPFYGTFYRRAYNYRQLQEWPWLAEPHEPVGYAAPCLAGPVAMPDVPHASPFVEEPMAGPEMIPRPPVPAAPPKN